MTRLHGCPAKLPAATLRLPLPLSSEAVDVISKAIRHAWALICADPETHLAPRGPGNPEEDIYSDAIKEILVGMLVNPDESVSGFSDLIFSDVLRGANVARPGAKSINKQPDLFVRLAGAEPSQIRSYHGLFIEAKVIKPRSGLSSYTDEGIKRIVDGDYAWMMQDAMMMAYQANPLKPIEKLSDRLAKKTNLGTRKVNGDLLRCNPMHNVCAVSLHARPWRHDDGTEPGDVQVWHLWNLSIPPRP